VFRLSKPAPAYLDRILEQARIESPTYGAVGATARAEFPPGFHHDRYERPFTGSDAFDRAREGLKHWAAHTGAGARVFPATPVEDGATVIVCFGLGPFRVITPCRIVYVIDEPDRFGFGYGTLPGHPECGEESFLVERVSGGAVFRIGAFSRPADLLARLGAPLGRRIQIRVSARYLDALASYVNRGDRT
jgi:uncharacterized protein (UPF0548 family)